MLLLALAGLAACSSDDTLESESTGISAQTWVAEVRSRAAGQTHTFSFRAAGNWQVVCDDPWCTPEPRTGSAGQRMLNLVTTENNTGAQRTTTVSVFVAGRPKPATFRMSQQAEDGDFPEADEWIYNYMMESYLWNEPLVDFLPDYSADYQTFFQSMLDFVAARKDDRGRPLNYDDGHWTDGKRDYFYSYVSGPEIGAQSLATRSVGDEITETGLWRVRAAYLATASGQVAGFIIEAVTPGTSAARAGLTRGIFISQVDGQTVTEANYRTLLQRLYYGSSVRLRPNRVSGDTAHAGRFVLTPQPEVTLSAETFVDPAVYKSGLTTVGGKKVAYLLYMGFDSLQDEALIETFKSFRGAEELILDLRYNGGGSVRSSTLLSTLIVGEAFKNEVYCRMTYNAQRMAKEEGGLYRIGNRNVSDGNGVYMPIETALSSALELRRLYVLCTESTASASELVINGLRGLGIDVRLIGTRTNGKNVGMEGYVDYKIEGDSYTFMPITFYSENKQGFRDYTDGFEPDVVLDMDAEGKMIYPGDFMTEDDRYYELAVSWIRNDRKPEISYSAAAGTRSVGRQLGEPVVRPTRPGGSVVFRDR